MTTPTEANLSLSPLIHLVDDDEGVRQSLTLLIGTVVGAGLGAIFGWEIAGRNIYHPQAPSISAPGSF